MRNSFDLSSVPFFALFTLFSVAFRSYDNVIIPSEQQMAQQARQNNQNSMSTTLFELRYSYSHVNWIKLYSETRIYSKSIVKRQYELCNADIKANKCSRKRERREQKLIILKWPGHYNCMWTLIHIQIQGFFFVLEFARMVVTAWQYLRYNFEIVLPYTKQHKCIGLILFSFFLFSFFFTKKEYFLVNNIRKTKTDANRSFTASQNSRCYL